jgi:GT2 family glycosyltransferase
MLERAIDSCRNQQSSHQIEVIVSEGPGRVGSNFNNGLAEAKGEYIKLLADDDTLRPNAIQDLVSVADKTGADIIHAKAANVFTGGVVKIHTPSPTVPTLQHLLRYNCIHAQTVMYRATLFERVGVWDEGLWTGEEYEFHLRCLHSGASIAYCDKVVCDYTRHEGQKSLGNPDPDYQAKRQAHIREFKERYL